MDTTVDMRAALQARLGFGYTLPPFMTGDNSSELYKVLTQEIALYFEPEREIRGERYGPYFGLCLWHSVDRAAQDTLEAEFRTAVSGSGKCGEVSADFAEGGGPLMIVCALLNTEPSGVAWLIAALEELERRVRSALAACPLGIKDSEAGLAQTPKLRRGSAE